MLREVLLALLGHSGDVITCSPPPHTLSVLPSLPFLHPSEVSAINSLLVLGTSYLRVSLWASTPQTSLFGSSLASGMEDYLHVYRLRVLEVEAELLAGLGSTLAYLHTRFAEFFHTLPSLAAMADALSPLPPAPDLLDMVHAASISGIPARAALWRSILARMHATLFSLCQSWMVEGVLDDPAGEWFIAQGEGSDQTGTESQSGGHDREQEQEQEKEKEDHGDLEGQALLSNWNSSYVLVPKALPSYFPPSLAAAILFTGKAVLVLRGIQRSRTLDALLAQSGAQTAFPTLSPNNGEARDSGPGPSSGKRQGTLLSEEELEEFTSILSGLGSAEEFVLADVKAGVEAIRSVVARHLFDLIVHQADLLGHLKAVKDYFLLGRGELYQTFLDDASDVLALPPSSLGGHELRNLYVQAASRCGAEADPYFARVELCIDLDAASGGGQGGHPPAAGSSTSAGAGDWKSMVSLSYNVPSPVHLVLDAPAMGMYKRLFSFLLVIRRVQLELHSAWVPQMRYKILPKDGSAPVRSVWLTRAKMAFLIDNLQYYLLCDVLEAQYGKLVEAIADSPDYEHVKAAHSEYIQNLVSLSFLRIKPVVNTLLSLFQTCSSYARLILTASQASGVVPASRAASLTSEFDRQSSFLFTVLSGVKQVQAAPHLAQLLLRIDFNRHFSEATVA